MNNNRFYVAYQNMFYLLSLDDMSTPNILASFEEQGYGKYECWQYSVDFLYRSFASQCVDLNVDYDFEKKMDFIKQLSEAEPDTEEGIIWYFYEMMASKEVDDLVKESKIEDFANEADQKFIEGISKIYSDHNVGFDRGPFFTVGNSEQKPQ